MRLLKSLPLLLFFCFWFTVEITKNGDAQYLLGLCYTEGKGVPKDDAEAVKWYRMAAEQGHAQAQNNLGACYARGEGVPKDAVTAYMWLNLASAQGHPIAMRENSDLTQRMTTEQIAEGQKLSREWLEKRENK